MATSVNVPVHSGASTPSTWLNNNAWGNNWNSNGAPFGGNWGNNSLAPWGGNWGSNNLAPWGGNWGSNSLAPWGGFGGFGAGFNNALAPFGAAERNIERVFKQLERNFGSELNLFSSRPSSYLEQYSLTNPIRIDAEGNRWLNVYFDLKSYKPEEINVTVNSKDRSLNVEASHEVKDKEHYIKRHYSRKVFIPEDVKIDLSKIELKPFLTNEGLLVLESALPKLTLEEARAAGSSKYLTAQPTNVYNVATKTI